ncbi:unnamed protein product [Acanthoscelides obtectus]|uniref:Uncharacterized protein n=1 Tax=Acanthoscelides obtectus TaxID=200917 RepID=A0A9P0KJZ9_ACAOB|nr:unnamed protein product [Acanthoscelides obtectus]CAK1668777.1 hypothetical protein AOBTE_LOCUS26605 [Acanthoscelides obtectus]
MIQNLIQFGKTKIESCLNQAFRQHTSRYRMFFGKTVITDTEQVDSTLRERVVKKLCESIQDKEVVLCFDRFFFYLASGFSSLCS